MSSLDSLRGRRFRASLVPTVAMVAVVSLTVALGNWQRHRAAEKSAQADQQAAAAQQPPFELSGGETDVAKLRYRRVRATGEYDSAHALLIDNKVHAGRAGFHVVVPFKIAGSTRHVLVDRGWIAQGPRRSELPSVPSPPGVVAVEGRANVPPQRYLELGKDAQQNNVWQNLDVERIAQATQLALLPFVIEQTDPVSPPDALIRDWPQADSGTMQHISYMMQWYSLAALAVILWLALNWRRDDVTDGNRR